MQNARSRVLRPNVAVHESFGCHPELLPALKYKVNPFAYKNIAIIANAVQVTI